jgi:hypothetical protein
VPCFAAWQEINYIEYRFGAADELSLFPGDTMHRDDDTARQAAEEALASIRAAAQAESEATEVTREAARLSDELEASHTALQKATLDASAAVEVIRRLYQHAAALKTIQGLTVDTQGVRDGDSARDAAVRAARRSVDAAEEAERIARAAFDTSAEAFKKEQDGMANVEAALRKAEEVCGVKDGSPCVQCCTIECASGDTSLSGNNLVKA